MSVTSRVDPVLDLDWIDPEQVYCGWAASAGHSFWLDAGPDAASGWSWIGIGAPVDPGDVRSVRIRSADHRDTGRGPTPEGWVGWLSYEDGAERAQAPAAAADGGGDRWMRVETVVGFDHATRRMSVSSAQASARDALVARLRDLSTPPSAPAPTAVEVRARHTPQQYAALIEQCRDQIRQGNAYQLCLTTRFSVAGEIDPVAAYRRLRSAVGAHRGGLIRHGDVALLSASPEQFLEVEAGRVRTQPIKGTRRRSADPLLDAALATELAGDVKERAENVMIVDLMRNDLSRVCTTGSVSVERLFAVETYPSVHQLVSSVVGELRAGLSVGEIWDATFPAGSMTGAPKLSAMTILHGLEGGPRGVYAGVFGWVTPDGGMDLAMVIRSIVVAGKSAYVGAGGGITWLSSPRFEVAEVALKARGPLAALGGAVPPGWEA